MPKKKVVNEELTSEQVAIIGINYLAKKDEEKKVKAQIAGLRTPLEQWMDKKEQEISGGSKMCEVSHAGNVISLKRTLRTTQELVPEAETILRANGLEDCIENVPIIREDRIESMYNAGKITDAQLKELYIGKASYAFSVSCKKKSEIPEV